MKHVEVKRKQIQIFSYIIWLITLLVISKIVGNAGVVYFVVAAEATTIFILLLSYSVPDTLGKILRSRSARNLYKNVKKIRKNILVFQCILATVGAAVLFFLSDFLANNLFKIPNSSIVIKILSPIVLIRTISSVLKGFFQGSGTEMPTVVVDVLRQVFTLGFGILFCNILKTYGEKASALLQNNTFTAMYGIMGIALAMLLAEILLLLFLFLIYLGSNNKSNHKLEGLNKTESFRESIGVFYGNMSFSIMNSLLARLPIWLGVVFFVRTVEENLIPEYGVYYGKYLVLCGFAIIPLCVLMLSMCTKVVNDLRKGEHHYARNEFQVGIQTGFVNTVFISTWMIALANQIAKLFAEKDAVLLAKMLQAGSFIIVSVVLCYFFLQLLTLNRKEIIVLFSLGVFNIFFVISLTLCLKLWKFGTLSLVYAGVASSLLMCIMLGYFAIKFLKTNISVVNAIVIPFIAASVIGVINALLGKLLAIPLGNIATLIVTYFIGTILYWLVLLLTKSYKEQDLFMIPGGNLILKLGHLLHLIE